MSDDLKLDPEVLAYYKRGKERDRLQGTSRLEFLRICELLSRFLPPPPASVLDVGGGPGAYALWLAERGYEVQLVDPVPLHVEQARAAGITGAVIGDARGLASGTESVNAVLLLGPLYHLVLRADRLVALREARRVVRSGGVVFAAAISRFSPNYEGLRLGLLDDAGFEQIVERGIESGVHENPTRREDWFTQAYLHRPDELRDELVAAGLAVEAVLAVQGPGGLLPNVDDWLDDPARRDRLLRAIRRVESEPSVLGATAHFVAVGRR
jgi:SAM-dependent methyltransferase